MASIVTCVVLAFGCVPHHNLTEPATTARGGLAIEASRGGEATQPPVVDAALMQDWICIHEHEAAWDDAGDPYWGGLQMDRSFMWTWGRDMIRKYHGALANAWSPRDQILVAERAREVRGWEPWPETSIACGLHYA